VSTNAADEQERHEQAEHDQDQDAAAIGLAGNGRA
jgi:hypothetical protein